MRIAICIFLIFGFDSICLGQSSEITLLICDQHSSTPIPYATINLFNANKYFDSDEKGKFSVSDKTNDSMFISSIGFKSGRFLISDYQNNDTLFLKKDVVLLEEIRLSKHISSKFGTVDIKHQRSIVGGTSLSRREVATLIEIPTNISYYRISKIFIKSKNFNKGNPVRLHIYDVNENGLPGKELLQKEVFITNATVKNNIITIDVRDQAIFLENSNFFAGIQWISSHKIQTYNGPELFETNKIKKILTYRRQLDIKSNAWFIETKKTNLLFFPGGMLSKDDSPLNVLTSAEIEIYN